MRNAITQNPSEKIPAGLREEKQLSPETPGARKMSPETQISNPDKMGTNATAVTADVQKLP